MVMQRGILRALGHQFRQQRLGKNILVRCDERGNRVRPRWPMDRIDRQRLRVERDGLKRTPLPEIDIAEIAPARRQARGQPQRGLVIHRRKLEIAPRHPGIAEPRMQLGYLLGGHAVARSIFNFRKTALIGGDRLIDPARAKILRAEAQLPHHE